MSTDQQEVAVPAQETPGIDALATGLNQNNIDLQRQTDAFHYFRHVLSQIGHITEQPDSPRTGLPFLIVRVPTDADAPAIYELDLNTFPVEHLQTLVPVFQMMAQQAGGDLLHAWDNVFTVIDQARPIVQSAMNQRSGGAAAAQ